MKSTVSFISADYRLTVSLVYNEGIKHLII